MIFDWLEYYLRFLSLEIFIFIERIHKGRKNIRGIYVKNYCMYHFFYFHFMMMLLFEVFLYLCTFNFFIYYILYFIIF